MRAHHWDWLHALTFALALLAFGDAERQIIRDARIATWPAADGSITRSAVEWVPLPGARGRSVYARRLTATYQFVFGGQRYSGRAISWYPRTDARKLAVGAPILIHYRADQPATNGVVEAPRFTVWIESFVGIMLLLASGLPWHRWRAHRDARLGADDLDPSPPVILEVSPDGVASPASQSPPQTITRAGR